MKEHRKAKASKTNTKKDDQAETEKDRNAKRDNEKKKDENKETTAGKNGGRPDHERT